MSWEDYIPEDINSLYEIYDYKHAAAIMANEFPEEFSDICYALRNFSIKISDITTAGGNESQIPKRFSDLLRPLHWHEKQFKAKLIVDDVPVNIESHRVDYIKNRVAFDLEWNSKDQTFDRDLYAFRAFFEYNKLSVGVLVTRSLELDSFFVSLGSYTQNDITKTYLSKYGASTTHIGKLLPRLESGRNGGCPVLVFGITSNLIEV